MTPWVFGDDVTAMVRSLQAEWPKLTDKRLFLTGGSGFIGRWMLSALVEADRQLDLGVQVDVLTRDAASAVLRIGELAANRCINLVEGDVRKLKAQGSRYDFVIHAATDASADLNENDPLRMFDTIVEGTRAALDFSRAVDAKRVFFLSSGAVYGAQPWQVAHVDEEFRGAPDLMTHRSSYGEGKRAAEMLCAIYRKQFEVDIVNARIFALLGPLLSLDIHFAAGNFIRDAMAGRQIVVQGAGTAVRSYLYAADLAVWLWKLLLAAKPGATYNVGSEEGVSIAELASRVAAVLGAPGVAILGQEDKGWNPGRYVPDTGRIRNELGVVPTVGLDEAIRRTALWNGWTE